jgi:radical SAM superfamily enzyme YgiQ (UPF0313 family)
MDAILLSSCISNNLTNLFRPLGPYQVAWYLREHNYNVKVIDFIFKFDEEQILILIDQYITLDTKIVGISGMIAFLNPSMFSIIKKFENVLKKVKTRYPWVKIVVGGPSAPFWAKLHRNGTLFDYVLTGHAENGVLALMNYLSKKGKHPQFELTDGNKFIREAFIMPEGNNFDIVTCKHKWHKMDDIQPGETLPLEIGRGCMFKCKFCRYPYVGKHKNDFNRDMECIKEELVDNYNNWGVTNYYIIDDTFNADQVRLKAFYEMTQTLPFKIQYATYLRPDLIAAHPDSEGYLYESGLLGAFLGVESLNAEACKVVGKPWSAKSARDYVPNLYHNIWKGEVSTIVGLICGIPPESFDDCKATSQWAIDSNLPAWVWYPLSIERDAEIEHKSEFDLRAEDYGFRWKTQYGRTIWITDYCDADKSVDWANELTDIAKPYQYINCWYLLELGSFGLDLHQMKKTKFQDADWRHINNLRSTWLKKYFNDVYTKVNCA